MAVVDYFSKGKVGSKINVHFVSLVSYRYPEKISLDVSHFQNVETLKIEISSKTGIEPLCMQITTVDGTETSKIFQSSDSFSMESLLNQTIMVYQTSLPESVFVPVNMYDVDLDCFFGIPIIVKLDAETNYIDLEERLMTMLLRFSRPNYPEPDPLINWWEDYVVQTESVLAEPQGETSDDGEIFKVHQAILIARSEVFATMLTSTIRTQEKETNMLVVKDVKPKVMKELLRGLYTGQINNIDEIALDLFVAADKYLLPKLKSMAAESIIRNMYYKSALKLAAFGNYYDYKDLVDLAISQILRNYDKIICLPDWPIFVRTHPDLIIRICEGLAPIQT
jgi:speckle-type POZ protein